ncbi:MAG: hypothetical protein ACRBCK_02765 [Alphaproteobacteria bacterium]
MRNFVIFMIAVFAPIFPSYAQSDSDTVHFIENFDVVGTNLSMDIEEIKKTYIGQGYAMSFGQSSFHLDFNKGEHDKVSVMIDQNTNAVTSIQYQCNAQKNPEGHAKVKKSTAALCQVHPDQRPCPGQSFGIPKNRNRAFIGLNNVGGYKYTLSLNPMMCQVSATKFPALRSRK